MPRRAALVVPEGQRPQPWLADRRGSRLHDAADQAMLLKSRAGDEGQRKDKLSARPTIDTPSAVLTRGGVVLLKTFTSIRHPRLGRVEALTLDMLVVSAQKKGPSLLRHGAL